MNAYQTRGGSIELANKRMGSAAVIMNDEGKVLLVKHNYGRFNWELPGGYAEQYESLEETAVREVFEETGLQVRATGLSGLYYEPSSDMHHTVFVCTQEDAAARPDPDESEISECGYWSVDALPRPISSFTMTRIQDALNTQPQFSLTTVSDRKWFE